MNSVVNDVPLLVGASVVTLALAALFVLLSWKIDTRHIGHIVGVGVPLILFGAATAGVQYHLYELRPDFFHDNGNAYLLYADVVVGMFAAFAVFRVFNNDED